MVGAGSSPPCREEGAGEVAHSLYLVEGALQREEGEEGEGEGEGEGEDTSSVDHTNNTHVSMIRFVL